MERVAPRSESKKLIDAVEHWFYGDGQPDPEQLAELRADAQAYNLELPEEVERPRPRLCAVLPENWSAVELFLRCSTQWRAGEPTAIGPCGVYGLDYPAVLAVGSLYLPGADLRPVLEDLQAMERHALLLAYRKAKEQRDAQK